MKIQKYQSPSGPSALWWEENTGFWDKPIDKTFVINNKVQSTPSLSVTNFGNPTTVLTDAIDLADPALNFKFFRKDPVTGMQFESPFVFPKQSKFSTEYPATTFKLWQFVKPQ